MNTPATQPTDEVPSSMITTPTPDATVGEMRFIVCPCGERYGIPENVPYGTGQHTTVAEAIDLIPSKYLGHLLAWGRAHKAHADEAAEIAREKKDEHQRLAAAGAKTDLTTADDFGSAFGARR